MCDAELKARNMIKGISDKELMVQWMVSSYVSISPELASVRGWLIDEIQTRFPKGFSKWLDQEDPRDEDLKYYIRAEMRERREREVG